jgi:hypothetical protein
MESLNAISPGPARAGINHRLAERERATKAIVPLFENRGTSQVESL